MLIPRFYFNIIIRVILLTITLIFVSILAIKLDQEYIFSFAGVVLLAVAQVILLMRYINRVNRDLSSFFTSITSRDSSLVFTKDHTEGIFKELYKSLNDFNEQISEVKRAGQIRDLFFQQLVDQVNVGIITFNESGEVDIYNKAAGILLNNKHVSNIETLSSTHPDLPELLLEIVPGKSRLIKIQDIGEKTVDGSIKHLSINTSIIKNEEGKKIKLVTLHNITSELERKEVDSWHKLIRVLTHEIMNSISPIISLTGTIAKYYKDGNDNPVGVDKIDQSIVKKTLGGLETIEETSKGLSSFVDKYRSLTSLPIPNISHFHVIKCFEKTSLLMDDELKGENIEVRTNVIPKNLELYADYGQVEQILINLIRNSIDGLKNKARPEIQLKAFNENGRIIIQVSDNGMGISKEIIDNVFVPFFTTKEGGSGIGLALSRQLMRLHEGTIYVSSVPDKETTVSLKF